MEQLVDVVAKEFKIEGILLQDLRQLWLLLGFLNFKSLEKIIYINLGKILIVTTNSHRWYDVEG